MRIKYVGDGNVCHKDLTVGREYEADIDGSVPNGWLKITSDDAGDRHDVQQHHCTVLDDRPAPADPQFDDSIPLPGGGSRHDDGIDWSQHLATEAKEESPTPEGPESTSDLRKYRFKPELY